MSWGAMLIIGNDEQPCAVCSKPTKKVDITFECAMCGIKCMKAMWKECEEQQKT